MGYNIEWARPEKTKVWSFGGRLYQSKRAAVTQWQYAVDRRKKYIEIHGETDPKTGDTWWFLKREIEPVYEVDWIWRALDDGEHT